MWPKNIRTLFLVDDILFFQQTEKINKFFFNLYNLYSKIYNIITSLQKNCFIKALYYICKDSVYSKHPIFGSNKGKHFCLGWHFSYNMW